MSSTPDLLTQKPFKLVIMRKSPRGLRPVFVGFYRTRAEAEASALSVPGDKRVITDNNKEKPN